MDVCLYVAYPMFVDDFLNIIIYTLLICSLIKNNMIRLSSNKEDTGDWCNVYLVMSVFSMASEFIVFSKNTYFKNGCCTWIYQDLDQKNLDLFQRDSRLLG